MKIYFFQKMKGKDKFSFCSSSLNDISLYLKQNKLGFTVGRCFLLYALVRAYSPFSFFFVLRKQNNSNSLTTITPSKT